MDTFNVNLVGNCGAEPEFKKSKDGEPYMTIRFIVTPRDSDMMQMTLYFWGKNYEYAKSQIQKGSRLYVSGKFTEKVHRKNSSNTIYYKNIQVAEFNVLSGGKPKEEKKPLSVENPIQSTLWEQNIQQGQVKEQPSQNMGIEQLTPDLIANALSKLLLQQIQTTQQPQPILSSPQPVMEQTQNYNEGEIDFQNLRPDFEVEKYTRDWKLG